MGLTSVVVVVIVCWNMKVCMYVVAFHFNSEIVKRVPILKSCNI